MRDDDRGIVRALENLQSMYITLATNDGGQLSDFADLRRQLIDLASVSKFLPEFVHRCRTSAQFWQFIKPKFSTYAERRQFIWTEFEPAIEYAEGKRSSPGDLIVEQGLADLDASHIHELWAKALQRRSNDAEGAITSARTLLESVCKLILDEAGEKYQDDAELPKLYSQTARLLHLAPSQHTEQIFKQILGGCHAVVEGVGAIRNRLSDAHGKGKAPIKPAARHAELVVNVAGAMAVFLAATWIHIREGS